jgi:hypothetical protein
VVLCVRSAEARQNKARLTHSEAGGRRKQGHTGGLTCTTREEGGGWRRREAEDREGEGRMEKGEGKEEMGGKEGGSGGEGRREKGEGKEEMGGRE